MINETTKSMESGAAGSAETLQNAEKYQQDTREKLRDDAVDWLKDHFACSTPLMSELDVWLDRQAAITERECRSLSEPYEDAAARTIGDLRAALDGTTAERNRARAELDCARAELDRWRDRAMRAESKGDTQKLNSLRNTLRRDWHTETVWRDAQSVYALRVDPDVLHPIPGFTRNSIYSESLAERDALQAKVDELQSRFDDFEGDCYRGATVVQWYEHSVLLQGKLDEMERTHMPLPVDAYGVPTHFGQRIEFRGHEGNVWLIGANEVMCTDRMCCPIGEYRNVQPDTVESLLEQFWRETDGIIFPSDNDGLLEKKKAEYAERIRKAVKNG